MINPAVAALARETSKILSKTGLCKYQALDHDTGKICIEYAVRLALANSACEYEYVTKSASKLALLASFREAFTAIAREQFPERVTSKTGVPILFNDHDDTTAEDMQLILEKIAAE